MEFPVVPGILDYDGMNTIGVSVWTQSGGPIEENVVEVGWRVVGFWESGFNSRFEDAGRLRPGWTGERERYA